jgi:hypothetical protein
LASGAADTTVTTSGTGTSLINTSAGGQHVLNSISAGANVTITDDDAGTLTIAATEDNLSNNDTDDLSEGTTNLYYTDARVDTALTTAGGDIIPATDNTQYLGSTSKRWHSLYLGPGSLYIDGHKVLGYDSGNDEILVTTDDDQSLDISAGGSGTNGTIKISSAGGITSLDDAILHIGPQAGGNTVYAHGTLEAPDLHNGDLEFSGTLINQTGSNQNLEIRTNGTGYIHWNSADVYIGPIAGAVKIDESSITTTAGDLTISATGNVNVAGHYTSAETDSAISTATAALVDSAPATLDTLNELAAALGDDANFSTTVTNSIATKWTQDNTKISNWDTAYSWGDHSVAGYLTAETNDLTSAVTWSNVPDANITQSSVTQHQAALSITESQISDLTHYTDSDARAAISLTTDSASLTYNSSTGAFVYTDPTGSPGPANRIQIDVRNETGSTITAGSAVYISGVSGNNELVTLADADGTNPAMGIVVSDITNNSNGIIVTNGEVTGIDTSAYTVNDTLYLSSTAGELTTTRPISTNQIVQNIARVVKVHAVTGIIVVQGSGRANDVPNLDDKDVFIGTTTGYEVRNLTTADITEDASNQFFTDARAISAVEGEATLDLTGVLTGTTAVLSGSSGGLTAPILELETDNSGWNRPGLMLKDSNGDAVSIVGEHNTTYDYYALNYTLDPNNTNGDTSTTNFAGDYYVSFSKEYSTPSSVKMNMNVYGANDGFNITARSDFGAFPTRYSARPIRFNGEKVEFYSSDNTTPFGNFNERLIIDENRSKFSNVVKLNNASSDPSGENGDMYYNTTTNKFRGYQNGAWINLDGS